MYGFAGTFFWVLLLVMAVRYFVWRGRWQDLQDILRRSNEEIADLKARIDELEGAGARRPWGRATGAAQVRPASVASPPVAAEPAPPAPVVPVPLEAEPLPDLSALADRLEAQSNPPPPPPSQAELAEALAERANQPEPPTPPAERVHRVWRTAMPVDQPASPPPPAKPVHRVWRTAMQVDQPASPPPPPRPQQPSPVAEAFGRLRGNPDLEAIIGTSWLNKIGVAVTVIGIATLSGYSLQYLGPAGKVGLGVIISLLLLAAGVWLETRRRYMLFARPLIGGGWALLYFTVYAAGAIPASRIITAPWLALAALLVVAAGMILHSLRYRNEIVTGMAYLLGFLAILIGSMEPTSLIAAGLLAASFVVIFRFIPWYRLSTGMVIVTWFTLWFWLTHNAHPEAPTPGAFWTIELVMIVYWAMFALADYMRVPQSGEQSWLQRVSVAINSLAFAALSFLMYTATFGTSSLHDFFGLIALGALAAAGIALWRGRDFSRVLHVTLAGANIAAAVPFAVNAWSWPAPWILLLWTGLAVLLGAVGLWRRQLAYRVEAYLIGALASVLTFAWVLEPVSLWGTLLTAELAGWRWPVAITAAVALYGGEVALFFCRDRIRRLEGVLGIVAGYAATALLAALVWRDLDNQYLGLLWLAGALLSFEFGYRFGHLHARIRGYLLAAMALGAILLVNTGLPWPIAFPAEEPWRWLSLALGAVAFLWLAFRLRHGGAKLLATETELAVLPAHVSAALVALLAWAELPDTGLTLGWAALALAYREAGARLRLPALRQEGYGLILIAWVRLFLFDFPRSDELLGISMLLWIALPVAAVLYYFRHATDALPPSSDVWGQIEKRLPISFSFMALAALLMTVWLEADPRLQVLVWTLMAVALLLAGSRLALRDYRLQAYLLMLGGLVRLFGFDFLEPGLIYGVSNRMIEALPLVALLYGVRYLMGGLVGDDPLTQLERRIPMVASFAGAITLAALIWFEAGASSAAVGWAVLALLLYGAGLQWQQGAYRAQAYGLGLIAFGQNLYANLPQVFADPVLERVTTTLIVVLTLLLLALVGRKRRAALALPPELTAAERLVTPVFTVLAALLAMVMIYSTVEFNLTTAAWTAEALVAIGLGFAVKERALRLSGLALLALCLGKGLILDLSGADAIVRIISFIGLGLILVGISFIYTRYRHVLRSYI